MVSARSSILTLRGSKCKGDEPGGGSPGLHKPGIKNFFLEKCRARKVGETRSAPLRARGASPLGNFQKRFPPHSAKADRYPKGPRLRLRRLGERKRVEPGPRSGFAREPLRARTPAPGLK